ncbi:Myristoyl-CoA:protein N-myristoyltransferase, N-terminal domain-domain-containing protein [Leucosporidium creatinivorum]|uniref:Glycylpeptide N-tetradecanoyltransferase n=1 Tax=Leucosporidium creatinivorum TaxID=106004 RepID=A0A1Y2F529_9BASI|nr:Myristoyl-CoA:protein N-myristoyltransferase, N-terminal domain-domain-containing protein [Leucosporidium creatinivorum]
MSDSSAAASSSQVQPIMEALSLQDDTILTAADLASDDEQAQEYDGNLPDFSDSEEATPPAATPTTPASTSRPPSTKPKGPPGRKKAPGAGSSLKKKLTSAIPGKDKKKAAASEDGQVVPANPAAPGGVKLTNEQLDAVMAQLVSQQPELEGKLTRQDVQEFIHTTGINKKVLQGKQGLMGKNEKDMASYKFWSTQPVVKLGTPEEDLTEGPLEANKPLESIRQEPVELHKDFNWVTMDLANDDERKEVYDLLTHHYVEDADATFRFDYSADFIEWALKPPGYIADWHVGIRVAGTGKLVAFISGIPLDLRVRNVTKRCTEINFLCVHKKLRSRRLAPLLIQEVTRRTHLKGIFQAIYTAGAYLPTPVSRCQYYHRNLNPQKLVKTGFSAIPRNSSLARMVQHYKMPEETKIPGLREIRKGDLKQASRLLRAYLARFEMAPVMSNKEVEHALWSGRGRDEGGKRVGQVVWTYVVEDPSNPGHITDVFSFYSLPSTAVKATPKTAINAAYLFYYATTACPSCADLGDGSVATPVVNWKDETAEQREVLGKRLRELVGDALILCQKLGFDVLNSLTLQDNVLFLEDLKFGRGDGFLHYYLYNYSTKPILGGIDMPADVNKGSGVGVVML